MSDTVTNRFRLLKPGVSQVLDPVQPIYVAQLAIKEAKVKDVKAFHNTFLLLHSNVLRY